MCEVKKKNGFASGIGFVLAAAGSAVGLGNLWGFPYKTAAYGGAAFVLVYILCVLFIGIVAMIAEIYLGRRSQSNTITAFKKVNKNMGWAGMLAIIIPTFIICYYSVLGGWTVRFTVNSFQWNEAFSNSNSFGSFISNPYMPVIFTVIFLAMSAIIIMGGVKDGIEKASKILMPALFIIVVLIAIYALCLGEGVAEGLNFYLNPDFSKLGFEGVLAAMGQAFYSLSLGMGIMIAYGSYTGKEIKIGKSAILVCIFDTLVALIAGLAIFTSIGHFNPNAFKEGSGVALKSVGLMYQTLPQVFASLGWFGKIVSFLFFAMVTIAALTSVISLLEVATQFVIQKFKVKRKKATLILALFCFAVSIPVAWSVGGAFNGKITLFGFDMLTFFDEITNTVLMPVGACVSCIVIGWLVEKGTFKQRLNPFNTYRALEQDGLALGKVGKLFAIMVKYVTPLLILLLEVFGIIAKFNEYFALNLNFVWILAGAIVLMAVGVTVYFVFFRNVETGCNADET
ncbi:MAG: sodium-dependent transporter [Clostridia bacterium]|nr:sodium-dependent transporter [Clostridia bacterium]